MPEFSIIPTRLAPKPRRKRPPRYTEKIWLVCAECKLGFLRQASVQRVRNKAKEHKGGGPFCNNKCKGRFLGKGNQKEVA